ncbi:MAG: ribbon-helix-helix domain-containing protein [Actinobacteria bacterium]|nr:ribbon-helix-helix domain-containing protein [Actinomycetota bacterium]
MRKRTVHLEQSQIERLDRLAEIVGCSRTHLIREGVEQVLRDGTARTFRSMGRGRSGGSVSRTWESDDLLRKVCGRS